ncbi:MAG: ABC transporter permease [Bacilli bacterium]|nr:ABC transporter permease [Bacilli bacterium]
MIEFAKRNLLIFFRDKTAVFFSLLATFIILGLYVLFLGDVWTSNFEQFANAREIMDNWVMAGLLAVTSVTTTMGAFGIMIIDKSKKINKDFYSSPIDRKAIAGGYILSSLLIGLIMSMITLILAEIYIVAEGGKLLDISSLLKVIGLIIIADLANTSLVFFITSFFKSETAFSTGSTIIGTLVGFLTGIYLPIGMLPKAVGMVIKLFPPSYAAMLIRQVMMANPISIAFSGIPIEYAADFKEMLGVTFNFGNFTISPLIGIIILLATTIIFFALAVVNISRKKK